MRRGVLISVAGHCAVGILAYVGLPQWVETETFDDSQTFETEFVTFAEPEPEEIPEPPPPPPPPPVAPPPPEAIAEPEIVPISEAIPQPKPKAEPPPIKQASVIPPKQKPKPPQPDFHSVLKRLGKETPPPRATPPPRTQPVSRLRAAALTRGEIDAIRRQIETNWSIPAGARDAEDLSVEIRIVLAPDGTVRNVSISDVARLAGHDYYRSAAESAKRAVLKSSPLRGLPPDKYEAWREIVLNFDPKSVLGP